jgi:hypothetical protein
MRLLLWISTGRWLGDLRKEVSPRKTLKGGTK